MLTFFRRIRQQLLTENKFSKYLLYALSEIILVVIGILIAVQLNNLNESNKIKKEEKLSLSKLHRESEAIVKSLHEYYSLKDSIVTSMEIVARAFHNNDFKNISNNTLLFGIESVGYYAAFNLPSSVYSELYSSGKLQNIESEKVLSSISDFYSELEFVRSQLDYFRNTASELEIDMHTDAYLYVYDSTILRRNGVIVDLEALRNNNNYKSRHVHGLRNQMVFRGYTTDLLKSAESMCMAIAAELKIECSSI